MPSPLGLVDYTTPYSSSNFSSLPTSHSYNSGKYTSLLTRGSKFYYRPLGEANRATVSQPDKIYGIADDDSVNDIHNITTNSIITYCQQEAYPAMYLSAADFAYLRDIGIYPNNRLIICRRFASPVYNDLTIVKMKPISTVIGWYNDNFPVKVSVGENWEKISGGFIETLEEMFNIKGKLTGGIGATGDVASSAVPLPGFAQGLQFHILKELGLTDADLNNLPEGNPNIINSARIRKLGDDEGLTSDINIDFETVYEQKFINNIDPELMFLDIIGNALRFGTSKSEFIITGKATGKIREFFNKFASGDWVGALTIVVDTVIEASKKFLAEIGKGIQNVISDVADGGIAAAFGDIGKFLAGPVLSKFRIKMGGVIAAMSGEPSTPWHVTVGNPKKPIFSSGDMLVSKVNIDFGPTLAFNDLPSTIIIKFTMTGARAYGLQEVFDKFNNGSGRSYESLPTNFDTQVTGNNQVPNNRDANESKLDNDQVQKIANNNTETAFLSDVDKNKVENASNVKDTVSTDNGKTAVPEATQPVVKPPQQLTPAQQQTLNQYNALNNNPSQSDPEDDV